MARSLTPEELAIALDLGTGIGTLVKRHRDDPFAAARDIEEMDGYTRGAMLLAAIVVLSESLP
jgi:hypothetical protein